MEAKEIQATQMSIQYEHLDDWFAADFLNIPPPQIQDKVVTVGYSIPEDVRATFKDDDGAEISVSIGINMPSVHSMGYEVHIRQQTEVNIYCNKMRHLDLYWKTLYVVQNFLSFVTLCAVHPLNIRLYPNVNSREYKSPLDIYTRLIFNKEKRKRSHPRQALIPRNSNVIDINNVLQCWLSSAKTLQPVHELFFSILYTPRIYERLKFLTLIQALEAYHRRTIGGFERPIDEHKQREQEILLSAPDQYRHWLKEKLQWSNELSLRKRLKDLWDKHSSLLEKHIRDGNFLNKVIDIRNYLTHYSDVFEEPPQNVHGLDDLIVKLGIFLIICLLGGLNITEQQLDMLLANEDFLWYKMTPALLTFIDE